MPFGIALFFVVLEEQMTMAITLMENQSDKLRGCGGRAPAAEALFAKRLV